MPSGWHSYLTVHPHHFQLFGVFPILDIQVYEVLYTGKISPHFIFALFALWLEGEFKTGPIELYIKDYLRQLDGERIQDWANQSWILIGRK